MLLTESTRSKANFPVLLGQVVPHFLHVVHQQDFSASADAAVVFQEDTFLVKACRKRLSKSKANVRASTSLRATPSRFPGHARPSSFDTEISRMPSGKFNLGAGDVNVVEGKLGNVSKFFALPSPEVSNDISAPTSWHVTASRVQWIARPGPKDVPGHIHGHAHTQTHAHKRVASETMAIQFEGENTTRSSRDWSPPQGAHTTVSVTQEYAANQPKPPSTMVRSRRGQREWIALVGHRGFKITKHFKDFVIDGFHAHHHGVSHLPKPLFSRHFIHPGLRRSKAQKGKVRPSTNTSSNTLPNG